jgi:hypothetical protein
MHPSLIASGGPAQAIHVAQQPIMVVPLQEILDMIYRILSNSGRRGGLHGSFR